MTVLSRTPPSILPLIEIPNPSPKEMKPAWEQNKDIFKSIDIDHFLSRKYIAHLFGDTFVEDSLHEGWYFGDALVHMIQVLDENTFSEEICSIKKDFEKCLEWQGRTLAVLFNLVDEESTLADVAMIKADLIGAIQGLEVGGHTLFPGGCKNHSVLYEVKRTDENSYDFIIYNTGEGILKHWIMLENEGSIKVKGAYKLTDIKLENFIETEFLDELIALRGSESDSFGYKLYEETLSILKGIREPVPINYREYMQSQRSGICTWKVLLAYLRYNLPIEQYKYLKLKMRLDVFDKWYDQGRELNFNEVNHKLLNRLVVNYERLFHKRDILPIEYSKEELLCLALLKVKKTFNHYHFLLTDQEKEKAEEWYTKYTNHSIYDYDGKVSYPQYEIEKRHFST